MKWIEKIKQMNSDEMAEFINNCSEYDGFGDEACRRCKHHENTGECTSEFLNRDCKIAVKNLLESEVDENGSAVKAD